VKALLMMGALASCIGLGMAAAKSPPGPSERVTVFAPYLIQKTAIGSTRAPIMVVTITRAVSYHDLNLKTVEDVTTLETRVKRAAHDICRELDRRYPKSVYVPLSGEKNCAQFAANSTMMQVKELVAAARAG
jgi:UrcA family protein